MKYVERLNYCTCRPRVASADLSEPLPVPVIDTDQRREPVCICHRAAPHPLVAEVRSAVRRDAIPRHIKPELVTLREW